MGMNGVAVARHGLILSQDGATASRMLFKGLRGLFYIIFDLKISKLDHWTNKNTEKSDIFYYGVALSIFCYMESPGPWFSLCPEGFFAFALLGDGSAISADSSYIFPAIRSEGTLY